MGSQWGGQRCGPSMLSNYREKTKTVLPAYPHTGTLCMEMADKTRVAPTTTTTTTNPILSHPGMKGWVTGEVGG